MSILLITCNALAHCRGYSYACWLLHLHFDGSLCGDARSVGNKVPMHSITATPPQRGSHFGRMAWELGPPCLGSDAALPIEILSRTIASRNPCSHQSGASVLLHNVQRCTTPTCSAFCAACAAAAAAASSFWGRSVCSCAPFMLMIYVYGASYHDFEAVAALLSGLHLLFDLLLSSAGRYALP